MTSTITDPASVSLTDIQREYARCCRMIRLSVTEDFVQVAALYRAQLRAWRQLRIVAIARQMTGDQTVGIGHLSATELVRLSASGPSAAVRTAARSALGLHAEEAHLRSVLGLPGRLPVAGGRG